MAEFKFNAVTAALELVEASASSTGPSQPGGLEWSEQYYNSVLAQRPWTEEYYQQVFDNGPAAWVRNSNWLAMPETDETTEAFYALRAVSNHDSNLTAFTIGNTPSGLSSSSGGDGTTYTVTSANYTKDQYTLLVIENSSSTSASEVLSITGALGSPTFTLVSTTQFNGGLNRVSVFSAVPTENYTGTLTVTFPDTQTGFLSNRSIFDGAVLSGTVVQAVTNTGSSSNPTASLAEFANPKNITVLVVAASSPAVVTEGTGFSSLTSTSTSSPDQRLATLFSSDQSTAPEATLATSSSWATVAIELKSQLLNLDWGDGSVEVVVPQGTVSHEYNYNSTAIQGTEAAVAFDSGTNQVNRLAHGYTDGSLVRFYNVQTTTSVTSTRPYYVVNSTTDSFQISESLGGTVVVINQSGTGDLLQYRQALISLAPANVDSRLFHLNLSVRHPLNQTQYESGWLDLYIGTPHLRVLAVQNSTPSLQSRLLERAVIRDIGSVTNMNSMFNGCSSLQTVPLFNTQAVTNMQSMFSSCSSLQTVPLFNTQAVTNMQSMFSSCSSLQTVPLFNTQAVTTMLSMFNGCSSLQTVPLFNTQAVTSMFSMFNGCSSLQTVPLFNTQAVTNMFGMFNGCTSLQTVPLFNTQAVTNMSSMFNGCTSLQTVPLFNTQAVTNMSSMFASCTSLQTVPLFNTQAVTNMSNMFSGCSSLQTVPLFNIRTTGPVDMSSMFQNCTSLQTVPLFNTQAVTNMQSMFSSCSSLQTVPLFNTQAVTNMGSMFSSCSSLQTVPLFNTQAVTSMGIMFSSCSSLQTVPLFNTQAVTTMNTMFSGCSSLQTVPLFNTQAVTSMGSMFNGCSSLQTVPLFNTQAVTTMNTMFGNCSSLQTVPALVTTTVSSSTNFSNMFISCSSLSRIEAKNFRFTFSVASCNLSAQALDEIYTNLPTVTGQTITVTGNWGTATDNPSIATAKGWTVTG
jgi:surface protein